MMYSTPLAEPLGIVLGTVAGRAGAELGKDIAREWGLPAPLGAGLGACVFHYLAGTAGKLLVNGGLLDAPGATVSVLASTPLTAVTHGIAEGVVEWLFPGAPRASS